MRCFDVVKLVSSYGGPALCDRTAVWGGGEFESSTCLQIWERPMHNWSFLCSSLSNSTFSPSIPGLKEVRVGFLNPSSYYIPFDKYHTSN